MHFTALDIQYIAARFGWLSASEIVYVPDCSPSPDDHECRLSVDSFHYPTLLPALFSDFMRRWQGTLEAKAALESEAKAAALEAAKADLETYGLERAARKEAKMSRNREQEQVYHWSCTEGCI